ncbi:hypothetical protein jhhlp_000619 [Lomentospora prolificans]|uniref:Uncharacterized protein n=1 Tax=Lomentospora prolificans TaxID=41688 RepID=A0A2N3NJ24_9PEZI|nr:hypothetical protein jhhlp_000619 [Lomentospora prolificans]
MQKAKLSSAAEPFCRVTIDSGGTIAFELAQKYMRRTRNIILAVVSAGMNIERDKAIGLAKRREVDPEVLGIITQVDRIED